MLQLLGFYAVFTPYDQSYDVWYAEIAIEVRKKVLNIDLDMNNPAEKTVTVTYDGKEHGIKYVIGIGMKITKPRKILQINLA